jgi:hypothetical protein
MAEGIRHLSVTVAPEHVLNGHLNPGACSDRLIRNLVDIFAMQKRLPGVPPRDWGEQQSPPSTSHLSFHFFSFHIEKGRN